MNSKTEQYRVLRNGRRMVLCKREAEIRIHEEIAFDKAHATGRAFYVVENEHKQIVHTSDPRTDLIVRVCVPLGTRRPD